jgi:hypothetical protein
MKQLISSLLIMAFLLPSMGFAAPARFGKADIEKEVDLAKSKLVEAHRNGCLPPTGTSNEKAWFDTHPMSESCFKLLGQLKSIEAQLNQQHTTLSQIEDGTCPTCKKNVQHPGDSLVANIGEIQHAQNACTPQKRTEVWSKCGSDVACLFVSNALSLPSMISGGLGNKLIPESMRKKGCTSNDGCMNQVAHAFVSSVFSFFTGAWDLLKMGYHAGVNGAKNLWNWMAGTEDHSSSAQLALAKASREPGVFNMLIHDFTGTMAKIWSGLVGALKHWLSHNMFCEEWSGRPQFSECKKPATGLECLGCKTLVTGLCSVSGALVAEIIPAFFTGGLATAAKYGVEGAAKLSKLIRVSEGTMRAIKTSRLARVAAASGQAVAVVGRVSGVTLVAKELLSLLSTYLASPAVRALKVSLSAMSETLRAGKLYLMASPAGPVLLTAGQAAKLAGKVVLYPIDNPMINGAFKAGGESFTALMTKSQKAASQMLVARAGVKADLAVTEARVAYDVSRTEATRSAYVAALKSTDRVALAKADPRLAEYNYVDFVTNYFPEVRYGEIATVAGALEVQKAENALRSVIESMPAGAQRDHFLKKFQEGLAGQARAAIIPSTVSRQSVIANSSLPSTERTGAVLNTAGIDASKITPAKREQIAAAIRKATETGDAAALRELPENIALKIKILKEAGISGPAANKIVDAGLVSRVRPEDQLPNLSSIIVAPVEPTELLSMATSKEYGPILNAVESARRPATARALKVLEEISPEEAANLYRKFTKRFAQVRAASAADSDAESLLAEVIRRSRAKGLTDSEIETKLDEAFGTCK